MCSCSHAHVLRVLALVGLASLESSSWTVFVVLWLRAFSSRQEPMFWPKGFWGRFCSDAIFSEANEHEKLLRTARARRPFSPRSYCRTFSVPITVASSQLEQSVPSPQAPRQPSCVILVRIWEERAGHVLICGCALRHQPGREGRKAPST